jgi:hypothetical protein
MKLLRTSLFVFLLLPALLQAQVKVGTAGATFLKLGVSARGAAMADAFLPLADDVSALYYNPAGLLNITEAQMGITHFQLPVNVALEWGGYVHPRVRNGVVISSLGIGLTFLHTDLMDVTTPQHSNGTGQQFNWSSLALGVTYMQRLTNKFGVGVTLKLINESTFEENATGWSADVGTYYDTNWRTVRLAMLISNFGPDLTFVETPYPLPINFRFGVGATPIHNDQHNLEVSFQFGHPNDNLEEADVGLEYIYKDFLALRWGKRINGWKRYQWDDGYYEGEDDDKPNVDHDPFVEYPIIESDGTPSLDGMTFGVGLHWGKWRADFAYLPNKFLGAHHFVTLSYKF